MSDAKQLNETLKRTAPAAWRCLSALGLKAVFPKGIPYQAAQARGTDMNATAGQFTDGAGAPLPLSLLADTVPNLDTKTTFLYTPIEGTLELRRAWQERMRRKGLGSTAPASLPFTTHGLTHGLSLLADLFIDEDTTVILPDPAWENYRLIFSMRSDCQFDSWSFFDGDKLNVQGLADALARNAGRKTVVLLNLPGNPTGFTPAADDIPAIVDVLTAHPGPAVAIVDDAYAGTSYEDDLMPRSLYWDLAEKADPERLFVVKVDGATKELLFFPSRVGFVTHATAERDGEDAVLSKLKCLVRGTSGCPSGPSQAMVLNALEHHDLDNAFAERHAVLAGRYRALKAALDASGPALVPFPFNSAYFALIGLPEGVDPDAIRLRLIDEFSVGTIAVPQVNALRVAYCSVKESDIAELVRRIEAAAS